MQNNTTKNINRNIEVIGQKDKQKHYETVHTNVFTIKVNRLNSTFKKQKLLDETL